MKTVRLATIAFCVALLLGLLQASEVELETNAADSGQSPGLAVGKAAPQFTLRDQYGKEVELSSLLKNGPVAVVFHRSVDWCLYCKLQMIQLQRIKKEIEGAGAQLVAISYDSPEKLKAYAKKQKITFSLLSDVGSKTIDAYEMRYKDAPPDVNGFARHGTFIIDGNGIIRSKMARLSYKEKPAIDDLIRRLRDARKPVKGENKS